MSPFEGQPTSDLVATCALLLAELNRRYPAPDAPHNPIEAACDRFDEFVSSLPDGDASCDCSTEHPGILYPWEGERGAHDGWTVVERCDECQRYDNDIEAARALIAQYPDLSQLRVSLDRLVLVK